MNKCQDVAAPKRRVLRLLARVAIIVALCALQVQAVSAADLPSLVRSRSSHLLTNMPTSGDWDLLAIAYKLEEPASYLSWEEAGELYRKALRELEEREGEPVELASAFLLRRIAVRDAHAGKIEASREQLRALGLVTSWKIIGPFENNNNAGFDVGHLPDGRIDLGRPLEGKVGEVSWRDLRYSVHGYNKVSSAVNPDRSVVSYVASVVTSPEGRDAVLRSGADGAYKVWINGELVLREETDLGAHFDRDAVGVRLKKGENLVVVKVASENRSSSGFYLRFTERDGRPLVLRASAEVPDNAKAAAPSLATKGRPHADPSEAARLAVSGDKADSMSLVRAALIARRLRRLDPTTPWRDLVDRALAPEGVEGRTLRESAEVLPEHWRRVEVLTRAMDDDLFDPWARFRWASEKRRSLGVGHTPLVKRHLRALIGKMEEGKKGHVRALAPRVHLARVLMGERFFSRALQVLKPLEGRFPESLPLLLVRRDLYKAMGRTEDHQKVVREIAGVRRYSSTYVYEAASSLLKGADAQGAMDLLGPFLEVNPGAFRAQVLYARALYQARKREEALQRLRDVLESSPGLAGVLSEVASLLERMERPGEALVAYREALASDPNNAALLERIRALQPNQVSFEAPYRFSVEDMVPAEDAAEAHKGQDYYYLKRQAVTRVTASGKANSFHQEMIHVLTEQGAKDWSYRRIYYSPGYERIELVSVRVRRADGSLSETYRRSDYDAGKGSGNLYYLRKFAYVQIPPLEPGDVVEFAWRELNTEKENHSAGYFGTLWSFESGVDIEHARYVLLMPEELPIHFRKPEVNGFQHQISDTTLQSKPYKAHVMEAKGVSRVLGDRRMPGRTEVFEYMLASTYETWDQVGKWWWNLIKDQLVVDAEVEQVVREVTAGKTTNLEKVKAIHNWVVKNTRYVGIEFGVHGWKPYRTTLCMRRKFGDCKDKASLIKVMLNAAGIDANLVLIRTRRLGQVAEAPANLAIFNHAIAYVPEFDLFLDGTAEFNGTSELPYSDQGQPCLIVEDGGKVRYLKTPVDSPDKNRKVRILKVDLNASPPVATGEFLATGSDAVYFRRKFDSAEKSEENLSRILAQIYPGARMKSVRFEETSDLEKPVRILFEFEGGSFIKQSGQQQFVYPSGQEIRLLDRYAPQATRSQDLVLSVPYVLKQKLVYTLPDGQSAAIPERKKGEGPFGSYEITARKVGDAVECEVTYSLKSNRISKEEYGAFRSWLQEADRALNQPLLLNQNKEQ